MGTVVLLWILNALGHIIRISYLLIEEPSYVTNHTTRQFLDSHCSKINFPRSLLFISEDRHS